MAPNGRSYSNNVRIFHADPQGKYIRLFNSSNFQDENIGGHIIQQNMNGRPVAMFRFPPRTVVKAGAYTTVWSASSMMKHNPPSNFLWKAQPHWKTGVNCTTILSKPNGQAISWTTPVLPYGINPSINTRESYITIDDVIKKNLSHINISPSVNTMLPQTQELLERSKFNNNNNNNNKITIEDINKPPGAKPRLSSTTLERPATVHVSDVHKHLRRAHQIAHGATKATQQRSVFIKTQPPTNQIIRNTRSAPLRQTYIVTY